MKYCRICSLYRSYVGYQLFGNISDVRLVGLRKNLNMRKLNDPSSAIDTKLFLKLIGNFLKVALAVAYLVYELTPT